MGKIVENTKRALWTLLWVGVVAAPGPGAVSADANRLRLATTTSTDNSGLLREILPEFEAKYGRLVHVIAVGTGKALQLGRTGDVDVLLVHDRVAELQFIENQFGVDRRDVMYNDFVIVGPSGDPAAIAGGQDGAAAFRRIADTGSLFISRGDDSGTHRKERQIWDFAGRSPSDQWYREVGQGMGKVLQMADELEAYTLSDRGTWLAYRQRVNLRVLVEGDLRLFNPYGVIAVNPALHPHVNYKSAREFIDWITSPPGQAAIARFKIDGERLFKPSAIPVSQD